MDTICPLCSIVRTGPFRLCLLHDTPREQDAPEPCDVLDCKREAVVKYCEQCAPNHYIPGKQQHGPFKPTCKCAEMAPTDDAALDVQDCAQSPDGTHCVHWWDGEPCHYCGSNEGEVDGE